MTTQINTQQDVVKDFRKIRDEISNEIKDMTFEQERAYFRQITCRQRKVFAHQGVWQNAG